MKKPAKKKNITVRAMAEYFGNVSPSYIGRLKEDGMPMTSFEAAETWRNEKMQRVGTRTKDLPEEPTAAADQISPPIEEEPEEEDHAELLGIEMTGLERELKTARAMARSAGRRVKEAERNPKFEAVIGQRQQTYNKAVENYERMEKSVRRERQARAELMTVDQHKVQLNRLYVPVVTLMRKMPRTLAIKICPGDDVAAEKILAEGIEEVITEMRRSLGTEEPNPDWHLTIFLAATLRDQGPEKAIELLDKAKAEVLAAIVGRPDVGISA
jgi:ribosome maturation factor RimP